MDFSNLYDAAYFGTRLSAARQASGLPASAQFDLARSPLSDVHLEAAASQFGGTQGNHGFGLSALFDHLISSSPQSVPVGDLRTMQQRLVSLGYMPQDVPLDGQWNADWSAAYRRHDRDTVQAMLAGSSPTSTTVQNGLRVLGYVTPASVFQGMVGAAKGLVDQTGHTLVRGGLVGGAAEGAAIGAGIGTAIPIPGVGTVSGAVVGAIAGGLIGFFGSLFAHHEDVGQALSPLDEYANRSSPAYVGSRGIWEDLSTVATGASLLIGGGDVAAGVKGAMSIADAAPEGASALRFALSRQPLEQPPFLSRLLLQGSAKGGARALAARTLGGAAVGGGAALLTGHPEDILPGALIGGGAASVLGPLLGDRVGTMLEFSRTRGLMASINTPAWRSAREIFTGFSKANVGIRTFGSFGYGKKPFPVLQQIEKAPELPSAVNWALFGLYPEQFFPLKLSDLASGADRLMGERGSIAYVHLAQSLNPKMSRADALELRNQWLGDTPAIRAKNHTFLLEGFGVDQTAADRVSAEHADIRQQYSAFSHARAGVVRELNAAKAAGDTEKIGSILNRGLAEPYHFASWLLLQAGRNRGLDALPQFLGAAEEAAKLTDRFRTGDLPVELLPEGWTAQSSPAGFERQQVQSRVTLQARKVSDLKSKLQSARPEERAPVAVQLDQEQKTLDDLKARLARIRPYVGRGLKDVVIAAVRAETPLRSDYERLSGEYTDLAKAQRAALKTRSDTQIQLASGKTEQWLDQQVAAGVLPARIAQDAKVAKPGPGISNFLKSMAKGAAKDVNVPADIKARFDALGYKPALTGPDLIMPTTQGTNLIGLGDYTRRRNFWESMGLGTHPNTNRELNAIRQAHIHNSVQDSLLRDGVTYSARGVIDLLGDHLAKIQDKVPSGFLDKVGKQLIQKTDLRDLSVDDIQAALQKVPGIAHDYEVASHLQAAIKRGTAFGGEVSLLHPLDSARALAFATRTAGLPGFADAIRTWHMKDPALWDAAVKGGEPRVSYVPEPDLVASKERARVERELETAVGKTKATKLGQRLKIMMLDSVAKYAVDSGQVGSYDEFFKGLSAEYQHQFSDEGDLNQLLQRFTDPATHQQFLDLAKGHLDSAYWYEESYLKLLDQFGGRHTLADGRPIDDFDLMAQLLAVTSWSASPDKNLADALDAFRNIKDPTRYSPAGITSEQQKAIDEITSGHTIDRWAGRTTPAPEAGKNAVSYEGEVFSSRVAMAREFKARGNVPYEALDKRLKTINFYHNLMQEGDRVTVDRRMKVMWGYPQNESSPAVYHEIEAGIRQVASDLKIRPMQAQAVLWAAFKDFLGEAIPAAERRQDYSAVAKLHGMLVQAKSNDSFATFLDEPWAKEAISQVYGDHAPIGVLTQRVQDDIKGSIAFGPDYNALIRFYRTADTSTLVHEYAHLLRRFLSPEDVAAVEDHYGVSVPRPGRNPAAPELRSLARQYTNEAGIPFDASAADEYVSVDEPRAARIAAAYENAPHNPTDPAVKRSYAAFNKETRDQYDFLVGHGYKLEPWAGPGQPYANSEEFARDVRENHHLYYYKTLNPGEASFGKERFTGKPSAKQVAGHPTLADADRATVDSAGNPYDPTYNDLFRAVHDVFGHAKEGMQTGARGEENAWRQHVRMYSPEAQRAMTTGTRGQNSWVNFGPQAKGVPLKDRVFAELKTTILPEEFNRLDSAAHEFRPVTAEEFIAQRGKAPAEHEHNLHPYTAKEIRDGGYQVFLSKDRKTGFLLKPDGDIANVFNNGGVRGAGTAAVIEAVHRGGKKLDFFEGRLEQIYGKLGFKEKGRYPFDLGLMRQAHPNFDPAVSGEPAMIESYLYAPQRRKLLAQSAPVDTGATAFQQGGNWSRNAEEAWAHDAERYLMSKIKPPRPVAGPMGRLFGAIGNMWGRMRGYAADRNLVNGPTRDLMDRVFGDSIKSIEQPPGRPALSPFAKNVFLGAATGAGLGYLEGRKGRDAEMGAVYGALAGLGIHQVARLTNGYLPDALVRVNSAIRYGLSFSFDARRYTKNNFIAMSRYGLPGMVNPEKYLRAAGDFESLFEKGALIRGDQVVHEAYRYMDQIYGRNWFSQLDGLDQFASARGILGFNPRAFEAAHAYLLRHSHPNWSDAQILDAVSHIEHYGPARTNLERSANFVFFPLSFEKKLLTAVQDALLQAPFRNLVVYEGLRRYYAAGYDKKMADFLDRHAPLLQQLGTLNAFSHGLGPGEFFLSGVGDRKSNLGRAAMLAGATFLGGSGLHTTGALGQAADLAVNAFTPLVVTGESIQAVGGIHNAVDILKSYVPFINDLSNVSRAFSDQLASLGPGGETPFSQLGDYYSNLRQFDYQLEPFSRAMGYSSVDGFLGSGMGSMYKPEHDQLKADLAQRYPAAIPMIASFTDKATINQKALLDLASIPHRTPAEDAILQLAQKQNEYGQMVNLGMPSSWVKANELSDIRAQAMRYAGDKQFVELWNQIFMSSYGPITEAVA